MLYSFATSSLVRNNDQTSYAVLHSIASRCAKNVVSEIRHYRNEHSDCSQVNSTEAVSTGQMSITRSSMATRSPPAPLVGSARRHCSGPQTLLLTSGFANTRPARLGLPVLNL